MAPDQQILILSGVKGDTRRYRAFHLREQLRIANIGVEVRHILDQGVDARIGAPIVLILQRVSCDRLVEKTIDQVHLRGGLVLADTDDLTFEPQAFQWIDSPDFKDRIRAQVYRETMLRNRQTLVACDGIIASTRYLANQASSLDRPVRVHRNAFSMEMLECANAAYQYRSKRPGNITIGYASGTPTHRRDFEIVRPVIQDLMRKFPQVCLETIGPLDLGAGWEPFTDRLTRRPSVNWRDLPTYLANWDINLAPLRLDNPFSQSKSEIKWLEAALVRVPTIASPTDAFSFAIEPGENGFLAKESIEWEGVLSWMILSEEKRIEVGNRAYEDALDGYHPRVRSQELVNLLNEMSAATGKSLLLEFCPGPDAVVERLDPELERQPTNIRRGWYELTHRGLWTLLRQVWVFFRRLITPIFPF
ncbi:MAG TPA: glycosyltransferase [Anaerolineaceae bacterium]|nr:glycosyltransferase [Anaerolineaceae bacterium]